MRVVPDDDDDGCVEVRRHDVIGLPDTRWYEYSVLVYDPPGSVKTDVLGRPGETPRPCASAHA